MRRATDRRDALLVVLAACALRIAFLAETRDDPLFHSLAIDARFYRDMGARFASGDFLFGSEPLWFAPLYPVLVGVATVFGLSPREIGLVQLASGVVTAFLAFRLGRTFSPLAGRIAGLAVALTPVSLVYENQLLYTSVSLLLTAAFLVVFVRAAKGAATHAAGGAGVLLGLLSLTSASALLFAPAAAWRFLRGRGWRTAVIFGVGLALPLLPVLLRNGIVGGVWSPITVNGGMLLATGFAKEALGGRAELRTPSDYGPSGSYLRDAERAAGREMTLRQASDWHRAQALQRIAADPGWAAGLVARKIGLLFQVREIDDNLGFENFRVRARSLRFWPGPWAWFVIGAVPGIMFALRGRDRAAAEARWVAAFVAVYALSLLPFFVTARYRLPLMVPLAALAGYGAVEIREALRRKEGMRALALPAVGVAVMLPLVLRDPGMREDPALTLNAQGSALLGDARPAEALALFDAALARDPSVAGVHANRALALLALGRNEEALAAAMRATELDPNLPDAWQTRGALLARGGNVAEAEPAFAQAARLRPNDPRILADWARALWITGRREEAIRVGHAAVEAGADAMRGLVAEWESARDEAPGARVP